MNIYSVGGVGDIVVGIKIFFILLGVSDILGTFNIKKWNVSGYIERFF
jgi:hypothetical protein